VPGAAASATGGQAVLDRESRDHREWGVVVDVPQGAFESIPHAILNFYHFITLSIKVVVGGRSLRAASDGVHTGLAALKHKPLHLA